MSSNFVGVTFANQRVTPIADALIRRAILPDGILSGCTMSYSGSTLTMGAGYMIACGREFQHAAAQNWAVVDATSGFARLLLTIDLTRTATADSFDQVVDTIEYATAEDGFPTLVQDDINASGTKYQVVACVVSLGTGGITGIVSQLGAASIHEILASFRSGMEVVKLWENTDTSHRFDTQTVAVDLTGCDGVCIYYKNQTTGSLFLNTGLIPLGQKGVLFYVFESGNQCYRPFVAGADGVAFEKGNYTGDASGDIFCLPAIIYGVKGITVSGTSA